MSRSRPTRGHALAPGSPDILVTAAAKGRTERDPRTTPLVRAPSFPNAPGVEEVMDAIEGTAPDDVGAPPDAAPGPATCCDRHPTDRSAHRADRGRIRIGSSNGTSQPTERLPSAIEVSAQSVLRRGNRRDAQPTTLGNRRQHQAGRSVFAPRM